MKSFLFRTTCVFFQARNPMFPSLWTWIFHQKTICKLIHLVFNRLWKFVLPTALFAQADQIEKVVLRLFFERKGRLYSSKGSCAKYLSYRTVLFATGLPLGKICKIVVLLDCPFCNPQDHDHLKNQCCNRFLHLQDSNHLKKMLLHWTVLFAISDHLQN